MLPIIVLVVNDILQLNYWNWLVISVSKNWWSGNHITEIDWRIKQNSNHAKYSGNIGVNSTQSKTTISNHKVCITKVEETAECSRCTQIYIFQKSEQSREPASRSKYFVSRVASLPCTRSKQNRLHCSWSPSAASPSSDPPAAPKVTWTGGHCCHG